MNNLPSFGSTRVLREDITNPNVLYCGTEFGIWASINRGASWANINGNLPTVAVHEVAQPTTASEIVVATHGRSVWVVDVNSLRQMPERTHPRRQRRQEDRSPEGRGDALRTRAGGALEARGRPRLPVLARGPQVLRHQSRARREPRLSADQARQVGVAQGHRRQRQGRPRVPHRPHRGRLPQPALEPEGRWRGRRRPLRRRWRWWRRRREAAWFPPAAIA